MEKAQALEIEEPRDEFQELLQTLPTESNWDGHLICKYQDLWLPKEFLKAITDFQRHFQAKDSDIILATLPKSGTTWLKALVFSIVNRNRYSVQQSPLLFSNPHSLVPFLEFNIYTEHENPNLDDMPSPRIFANHIQYHAYPPSVLQSECRIIYMCRNPLDQFISYRYFVLQNTSDEMRRQILPLDGSFDLYCNGICKIGPFWDHMLGYWNASLENPKKVLILKYEDLKEDTISCVKKIADFLGLQFAEGEEGEEQVEEIIRLCSIESLKNMEVNNKGHSSFRQVVMKNSSFFRKGEVGDWVHHITPPMAERINNIMKEKFGESGLTLENNCNPKWLGSGAQ